MTESPAESSSQALERFLIAQLEGLSLTAPIEDIEFMARFVEEEGLEREEKVEGVKGMLEGVVDGGELPDGTDDAMSKVVDEWERLQEEERITKERTEKAAKEAEKNQTPPKSPPPTLSDKEIARAHALRYAYIEGDLPPLDDDPILGAISTSKMPGGIGGEAPPPKNLRMTEAEAKKAAEEKQAMIEAALKLDAKKKKYRKQQEIDLLAPNLNRDKMAYKAQLEREAAKKDSQQKKDRDKAALEKQRADQAKAKADKQKKAQKGERRA